MQELLQKFLNGLYYWSYPLLICAWFLKIKFEKSSSRNWISNLQKLVSKLIFAGYAGIKNLVWNRLKIQFVKLHFSNLIFQNSSTDQQGVSPDTYFWCKLITFCIRMSIQTVKVCTTIDSIFAIQNYNLPAKDVLTSNENSWTIKSSLQFFLSS